MSSAREDIILRRFDACGERIRGVEEALVDTGGTSKNCLKVGPKGIGTWIEIL